MVLPVLQPQIQPESGLTVPWAEIIQKGEGSTAEASFGLDGNQASMHVLVNFADTDTAIDQILGYAISNGNGNGMSRTLPWRHPSFPQFWAKRITRAKGLQWLDKGEGFDPGTGKGARSDYTWTILDVTFSTVPYRVMSDALLGSQFAGNEWERYCDFRKQPSGEVIHLDRTNAFKYAEGVKAGVGVVPFGPTKLLPKEEIHVTWYEVPHLGLFNTSDPDGEAINIINCVGKVNSLPFLGYPAGTLLFEPAKYTPVMSGVSPDLLNLNILYDPPRAWNVDFMLKFFDPPHEIGLTRGWNTALDLNSGLNKFIYHLITTDGTATGGTLYGTVDFATAFQMCDGAPFPP